jgi:hypothetical protein
MYWFGVQLHVTSTEIEYPLKRNGHYMYHDVWAGCSPSHTMARSAAYIQEQSNPAQQFPLCIQLKQGLSEDVEEQKC